MAVMVVMLTMMGGEECSAVEWSGMELWAWGLYGEVVMLCKVVRDGL